MKAFTCLTSENNNSGKCRNNRNNFIRQKQYYLPGLRKSPPRGHTFLELMVVISMLIFATIMVVSLLDYGLRSFREINERIESQQKTLTLLSRFNREVCQTAFQSITFSYPSGNPDNGDLALSFMTPENENGVYQADTNEYPIYQAYLIYFLDTDSSTLRRIRVPLSTPTTDPEALSTSALNTYVENQPSEVIAREVMSFKAFSCGSSTEITIPENPFKLEIRLEGADESTIGKAGILTRTFLIPR